MNRYFLIIIFCLLICFCCHPSAYAFQECWNKVTNTGLGGVDIASDDYNAYVLLNETSRTSIIKYDLDGKIIWRYNHNNIQGHKIKVDSYGCIYVVSSFSYFYSPAVYMNTICIDPSGKLLWSVDYTEGPKTIPKDLILDESRGVLFVVAATTRRWKFDYLSIQYEMSSGWEYWKRHYNSAFDNNDEPVAAALGSDGSLYITGNSHNGSNRGQKHGYDIATVKYDYFGNQLWVKRIDYGIKDVASGISLDSQNNCIVVGTVSNINKGCTYTDLGKGVITVYKTECFTIKYNSTGHEIWQDKTTYETNNGYVYEWFTEGSGVVCDSTDNVYVLARADNHSVIAIKYNNKGFKEWRKKKMPVRAELIGLTKPRIILGNYIDTNNMQQETIFVLFHSDSDFHNLYGQYHYIEIVE